MNAEPKNRLWWWVAGAFALLIAAWAVMFVVASANRAEEIPLPQRNGVAR